MSDSTRRAFLLGLGAGGAALLAGGRGVFGGEDGAGEKMTTGMAAVDHLLLGVADLDAGIAWVEAKTGVKAQVGGSHPGVGTRNALVTLGERKYLEIIGPDPAQKDYNFFFDVRKLKEPRLITWAATAGDVAQLTERARSAGLKVFGPNEGSRERPDGKKLQWKTLAILAELGAANDARCRPIPFFIEWSADSPHPAKDAPRGCELVSFEIRHPSHTAVSDTLRKLRLDVTVTEAAEAELVATLKTPKGSVTLR